MKNMLLSAFEWTRVVFSRFVIYRIIITAAENDKWIDQKRGLDQNLKVQDSFSNLYAKPLLFLHTIQVLPFG